MAETRTPVFVQLPGDTDKSLAGELAWNPDTEVGAFSYDSSYLQRKDAYLLDPLALRPHTRKETRNHGIYGILRDAGPDAWGRDQLLHAHGTLDEISILRHAPQDGAGNITFHESQHLRAYTLEEIDAVSAGFPPADSALANAVAQTTSMGGAKPKLLAYDAGLFWIAKFPEKGDPEHSGPGNEHAMLEMASTCEIDAAASRVHVLPDGRRILLVKRFDLHGTPAQFTRLGYASAHTVLGMGDPRREGELKSYPLLRHQARLWTRQEVGFALWQRLAFNALVANGDDHPRNHALLYDGAWRLSSAFDIVAAPGSGAVRLCLQIHTGSVIATPESLLISAAEMGVERDQAVATLQRMAYVVLNEWRGRVTPHMGAAAVAQLQSAFRLAESVRKCDFARILPPPRKKRY